MAGVFKGSVPDDRTEMDRPSIPGDPPQPRGGSSPTSVSDAIAAAPVQILVGATSPANIDNTKYFVIKIIL